MLKALPPSPPRPPTIETAWDGLHADLVRKAKQIKEKTRPNMGNGVLYSDIEMEDSWWGALEDKLRALGFGATVRSKHFVDIT